MTWIKEFSKSAASLFKGQVLEGFQPLDFYHFYPLWYDVWMSNIAKVIKKLNLATKNFNEIREILPPPSNMRAILIKTITAYYANPVVNKQNYELVSNFFARLLTESCPDDPFALTSNPLHDNSEIAYLVKQIEWSKADTQSARIIGQCITAIGSFVHGIYNDLVTDFGWDAYGPYALPSNQTLLIRSFPNLQPRELWPEIYLSSINNITIYSAYEGVDWAISFVGCHTISKGRSPVQGMKKFAVYADGKLLDINQISMLTDELAVKAADIYKIIHKMDFEKLKLLVLKQECYQLKKVFDKAGINWLPTGEMAARIENKPLLKNVFPHGKLIKTTAEFENIFGINTFQKEVLGSN
ncbi:MAG: hypothetical protein WC544_01075 [Patescibacteria group bacterium]